MWMWRTATMTLATALAVTVAATPADAKSKRGKRTCAAPYPAERTVRREDPDSHICIRARNLDPAGNLAGYPCWARAALSPQPRR
jgi:hypothetical protein